MSAQEFKPGDRVRCIDADGAGEELVKGCEYTVSTRPAPSGATVNLVAVHRPWSRGRFEKVGCTCFFGGRTTEDRIARCPVHRTHAEPEDAADVEPEPLKEGEDDERIGAWERVADHPIFRPCYAEERPLIDAVMAKLDRIYSEGASPMRPEEPTILGAVVFSESHGKIWTRASDDPNEPFAWAGNRDRCWFNWRQLPDDVAVVDPKDLTRGGAS